MSNGGLTLLLQEVELAGSSGEVGELWQDIEEGLREQAARLSSDLALSHQENRELQERLMVSEATVHAQAEQLKDYRDLLSESLSRTRKKKRHDNKSKQCSKTLLATRCKYCSYHVSAAETSVQQASKQVQVDLQDLGYETCGRSENEAEREDASSPGDKQTEPLSNYYTTNGQPLTNPASMCLFHLSLLQSLMTWRCARRCPINRTMRVRAAAGTLVAAAVTEGRMNWGMSQPLSSIWSRISAHS